MRLLVAWATHGFGPAIAVAGDGFVHPGQAYSGAHGLPPTAGIEVRATCDTRTVIHRAAFGGKHALPAPRTVSVGICALQGIGERPRAVALHKVNGVHLLRPRQMLRSRCHPMLWQHRAPILCALAIAAKAHRLCNIDIFDPHTLQIPHAAAIEQCGYSSRHTHRGRTADVWSLFSLGEGVGNPLPGIPPRLSPPSAHSAAPPLAPPEPPGAAAGATAPLC